MHSDYNTNSPTLKIQKFNKKYGCRYGVDPTDGLYITIWKIGLVGSTKDKEMQLKVDSNVIVKSTYKADKLDVEELLRLAKRYSHKIGKINEGTLRYQHEKFINKKISIPNEADTATSN